MTPVKLSWVLILVASGLALSAPSLSASESENQGSVKNSSPSPPTWEQRQRETKQQPSDTQGNPLPPWKSLTVSQFENNPKKEAIRQQPQGPYYDWFWPPSWSGWAQVIVAGFGLFFIWRTLQAIERQAEANSLTANAATDANRIANASLTIVQRAYVKISHRPPGCAVHPIQAVRMRWFSTSRIMGARLPM